MLIIFALFQILACGYYLYQAKEMQKMLKAYEFHSELDKVWVNHYTAVSKDLNLLTDGLASGMTLTEIANLRLELYYLRTKRLHEALDKVTLSN